MPAAKKKDDDVPAEPAEVEPPAGVLVYVKQTRKVVPDGPRDSA